MSDTIYYHFTGKKLRDEKPIPPIGEWLVFDGTPLPCECGYHASPDPFDALQYAPGSLCHQVKLGGVIVPHGRPVNKYAAQRRMIVASIDVTAIIGLFARRVALDVIHLWDAPPVVREFLETGDKSKRAAARDAAWAAAGAAVWAAARAAAGDAARAASGAAVWAAAWAAKQALYRAWFNEMIEAGFADQEAKA